MKNINIPRSWSMVSPTIIKASASVARVSHIWTYQIIDSTGEAITKNEAGKPIRAGYNQAATAERHARRLDGSVRMAWIATPVGVFDIYQERANIINDRGYTKTPVAIPSLGFTLPKPKLDIYATCPACSGPRDSVKADRLGDSVFKCRDCSAQFGRVQHWSEYVSFAKGGGFGDGDAVAYFDYVSSSRGGDRFHGWINSRGFVVQTG